jgi:pimeloyl-ACP methyl ester carboxylesterase
MTDLHVAAVGHGIPGLFVHGLFTWGLDSFAHQQSLANGHRVALMDRRGFGASPPGDRLGWPTDMYDIASLLEELGGAHLVGHSTGAISSLLAAGLQPELVRSLVVIEPPLFRVAADDPDVAPISAALEAVVHRAPELSTADFASEWAMALGRDSAGVAAWTSSFTDRDWAAAEASRHEAWAGAAPVDFGSLAPASFPKVIVVGGWPESVAPGRAATGRAYRAVGTAIARRVSGDLIVLAESSHNPQFEEPERLNALLERVWRQGEEGRAKS